MVREALLSRNHPAAVAERSAHAEKRAAQTRHADRVKGLKSKNFEQLNPAQKDKLLKALAIQMGLIEDSTD